MPDSSASRRAIAIEQEYVDRAYGLLDAQAAAYRERLVQVRAQRGQENPQEMSERDSFAAHYEDALARLRGVEHRLVLGRLDDTEGNTRHIGRIGLADEHQNIALLDWRAPQAAPFYQATAAHPQGIVLRRHISTRLREVTGVEDELLGEDEAHTDVELTGEGALMAALRSARSGKMGDIVATIQAEQDRIIRADESGVLIVQGGPGTGKTAVALHRAAYLLYAHRERLARSGVLIVGPSDMFLSYIDRVLPSLGESDVVSATLESLVPGLRATATDTREVAEIKGRRIFRRICRRAVRTILERPLDKPIAITVGTDRLVLHPADVAEAQRRAREASSHHNVARDTYARYLVTALAGQAADAAGTTLAESPWIVQDVASSADARREINLRWLPSSSLDLLERLWAHPHLLAEVAPELSEEERAALQREKGSALTAGDIALIDELADVLGPYESPAQQALRLANQAEREELGAYMSETMKSMGLGGGIVSAEALAERHAARSGGSSLADRAAADAQWTYGHVVIDEAQELTAMQWEMVIRRCPSRSMTIVGDVDQRSAGAPEGGWPALLGRLGSSARVEELTVSYRTPGAILRAAGAVLEASGVQVRPVRAAREEAECLATVQVEELAAGIREAAIRERTRLDDEVGRGEGILAIIVPEGREKSIREACACLEGDGRVEVLNPTQAKGLEFDVVILGEPAEVLLEGPGNLYVAMTRPTRRLVAVYTDTLPEGFTS